MVSAVHVNCGLRACVLGAAPDTGNLGVSALCLSTVRAAHEVCPNLSITVFDEGRGCRQAAIDSDGQTVQYKLCGERYSKRFWRAESLMNIRLSSWIGGGWNQSARAILDTDV